MATGDKQGVTWDTSGGTPLDLAALEDPLQDLEPLRGIVGEAVVVGIGVTTHGARELTTLAYRMARFLVERLGFRAVAMDEESAVGERADRYVTRGDGDPRSVAGALWPHHRTVEMLGLLGWMRDRARADPGDPPHFVGLSPSSDGFTGDDWIGYVEPRLADAALRWHDRTGARLAVISGITHTAVAPERAVTIGASTVVHPNAGSHLHDRLGGGYVSLGLAFHNGVIDIGTGPCEVPCPPAGLLEATLGEPPSPVLYDLRPAATGTARRWAEGPARLRLVGPAFDPADPSKATMSGGSLAQWFNAFAHLGRVQPVQPLRPAGRP